MRVLALTAGMFLIPLVWAQGGYHADLDSGSLRLEQAIGPGFSRALTGKKEDAYPPFVLGVLDLERRRDLGRNGARQLAVEGQALSKQIADREAYMAELEDLATKQEVVIRMLKSRLQQGDGRSRARRLVAPESSIAGTTPEEFVVHISALLVIALLLSLGLYFRSRFAERRLVAAALRGEVDRRHSRLERRHHEMTQEGSTQPVDETMVLAEPVDIPEKVSQQATESVVEAAQDPAIVDVAQELREIDTLLAYEDYEGAGNRLLELIEAYPENPEFRLRLLHLQSVQGDTEASAAESEILATMMDGPLSDTLRRVQSVGHEMLPGHPLFSAASEDSKSEAVEDSDELQRTQILNLSPKSGKE